jgi:hypothetical protein
MRKTLFKTVTIGLFMASLFFTIATGENGQFTFFKQAKAQADWQAYKWTCAGGTVTITVCGVGGSGCTPAGSCGKQ